MNAPVAAEPSRITPSHLLGIRDELIRREPIFHRPEFGTTREAFEAMTDEAFWEVGASGKRYSREFVIRTMLDRYATPDVDDWRAEDFCCQELAPNLYLLTYTLHQGSRITRRSTLWRSATQGWRIVFHQGTIVEPGANEIAA